MKYRITDSKGDDYYNDVHTYPSLEEAEEGLEQAKEWAMAESKREPSWKDANLIIVVEDTEDEQP